MKHIIRMAVIAFAVMLAQSYTAMAQNPYYAPRTLVLSNDTKDEIAYCYAYFDMTTNIWTSVGWTKIMAYSKSAITIGNTTTPTVFVHAHNSQGNIWGGDNYFSTSEDAFRIPYADKEGLGNKKRFRPIILNDVGETYYSLHY